MEEIDETKIEELDLYELLDIEINSTSVEIKKAYRKKALKCHPDKNPDNPNAAKQFHLLSKVLEILTDEAAKNAYDRVLKGRKEAALRHKELDGKRRKLKEELEARERLASQKVGAKSADQKLKEEIERLRKEGSRQVEEEMAYILKEINKEAENEKEWDSAKYRIKIKWNCAKDDITNGGYTPEKLHQFLSKYGDIEALVVSEKKRGTALVEFAKKNAALMAMELEIGLTVNPLKLEWVNKPPPTNKNIHYGGQSSLIKETDFESVVLTRMRQAEERKRLIEQMQEEDKLENS